MNTKRVALISSIIPEESGGGRSLLYRHFRDAEEIDLLVISDGEVEGFNHSILPHRLSSRVFRRLVNSPIKHLGIACQELFAPCSRKKVMEICQNFQPDLIVTVAHGSFAKLALDTANSLKLPLVTFFHDWWPDLSGAHPWIRPMQDRQFSHLHQASAFSLCICKGMLDTLGNSPGSKVLFPIPNKATKFEASRTPSSAFRVFYMGNLGEYGEMIQSALVESSSHPEVRLEVRGTPTDWSDGFENEMKKEGLLHGFASSTELDRWLNEADAFLVAMRFDSSMRRFMETSFPSKLTHYAQFHKPMIVWGPKHCSAIRWARENDSALCVTDPSPAALMESLKSLSPNLRKQLAANISEAASKEFNPEKIQRQFLDVVSMAVAESENGDIENRESLFRSPSNISA